MGESLHLTLVGQAVPLVLRMKLLLWVSLLGLEALASSQVSDCSMNCSKGCQCPCAKAKTKPLQKFTKMKGKGKNKKPVANAPCLYDPEAGNTCGRCINGGKQCGTPMQKWCQNPKSKNGCPGIPGNKFTLSTTGFPCYWDHSNKECAWCKTSKMKQCGVSSYTEACGQICAQAKNKNCDGNLFDCTQIPACGKEATCDQKSKQCKCDKDLTGNGQQCFEGDCSTGNCTLLVNVEENIEVSIDTNSQYFVFARGSVEL